MVFVSSAAFTCLHGSFPWFDSCPHWHSCLGAQGHEQLVRDGLPCPDVAPGQVVARMLPHAADELRRAASRVLFPRS